MPWTGSSFRKHNKRLSDVAAAHAARIANAVLRESGDEGKAVRIANYQMGRLEGVLKKRR